MLNAAEWQGVQWPLPNRLQLTLVNVLLETIKLLFPELHTVPNYVKLAGRMNWKLFAMKILSLKHWIYWAV